MRNCLGTDKKLTSLFCFGTRRNQLLLILNGQAWKSSLPEEGKGAEKQSFGEGSGQDIQKAGFCWKLCSIAKTRWKDQFGLYELVPSFFWVCFSSSVKQVGPSGCRADIQGSGPKKMIRSPSYLALGLRQGLGRGQRAKAQREAGTTTRAMAEAFRSAQLMVTSWEPLHCFEQPPHHPPPSISDLTLPSSSLSAPLTPHRPCNGIWAHWLQHLAFSKGADLDLFFGPSCFGPPQVRYPDSDVLVRYGCCEK